LGPVEAGGQRLRVLQVVFAMSYGVDIEWLECAKRIGVLILGSMEYK